ncbi:hypothetical protein IEQ34_006730 [Dendrobium chrysotoxum]|uniref:Protein kinase domain-containing protein n=1 Tax=Dendrobium chrysotoxum TaxID=161865 RepID=A0AAV7H7B1_DENCH|nr:hypothetical protein IEQ34_006730 [Dendrobium chrysotoxum]
MSWKGYSEVHLLKSLQHNNIIKFCSFLGYGKHTPAELKIAADLIEEDHVLVQFSNYKNISRR